MIKALGKVCFYSLIALLWLGIFLALAELHFIWRWERIPENNPIAQARSMESLWPLPPEGSRPLKSGSRAIQPIPVDWERLSQEATADARDLPPYPTEALWRNRADFFLGLPPERKTAFYVQSGVSVAFLDPEGAIEEEWHPQTNLSPYALSTSLAPLLQKLPSLLAAPFSYHEVREGDYMLCTAARAFQPADGKAPHLILHKAYPLSQYDDPEFMWRNPFYSYKPHAVGHGGLFRTNNFGFRDTEAPHPKQEGHFRILCIGGSTTEEGDINATTYPNLLEKKLQQHFNSDAIEVINCGISGMNTFKEATRLPDYNALEPDLVIFYNAVNDLCHFHMPAWVEDMGRGKRLLRRSRFLTYYANRWLLPSKAEQLRAIREESIGNLEFMRAYFSEHGAQVFYCTFAHPYLEGLSREERNYYEYFNALEWGGKYFTFKSYCRLVRLFNTELEAAAKASGTPCIPLAETLRGGAIYFGDNCHMKNPGIELKADIILTHLLPWISDHWRP